MEPTKECTKCGKVKSFSAFSKHRLSKDGHAYQCKECGNKRAKAWRSTPSGIYTQIKSQALWHGIKPFSLEKDPFIKWYDSQERRCVYCDLLEEDLWIWRDHFKSNSARLTIDCKDNLAGYTFENIVLACERCNLMKGNLLSFSQMREIGQKYIKPIWKKIKDTSARNEK